MPNSNSRTRDEILTYVGPELSKVLCELSTKDWDLFDSFNIDPTKSYLVHGTKESLVKFEAYFLFKSAYLRPIHKKYMLKDYLTLSMLDDLEETLDRSLIFLYCPANSFGIGRAELWTASSLIDKIANRSRDGEMTVVLSERSIPLLEVSGEVIVIKLNEVKLPKSYDPQQPVVDVQKSEEEEENIESNQADTFKNIVFKSNAKDDAKNVLLEGSEDLSKDGPKSEKS